MFNYNSLLVFAFCYHIVTIIRSQQKQPTLPIASQISLQKPLNIIHCDEDIIVVNKPHNVQTAPGFVDKECLAGYVAEEFGLARIDKMIVHRLDYATSGILCFARNNNSLSHLHAQFRKPYGIYKSYSSIVNGRMSTYEGEIDLPLDKDHQRGPPFCCVNTTSTTSKKSFTEWKIVKQGRFNSQLKLRPRTGRTHQLRIHLASMNHPILGDYFYSPSQVYEMSDRLLLHAEELCLLHPRTLQPMQFRAPIPFHIEDYD